MKNNLLKIAVLALIGISSLVGLSFAPSALAAPREASDPCAADLPPTIREANGCESSSKDDFPETVKNILTAIISVAGIVAVIFVIIGGVMYMTSAGDTGKLKKAKDTILYALIGLVICVLSFAIVNFTVNSIINSGSDTSEDNSESTTNQDNEQKKETDNLLKK